MDLANTSKSNGLPIFSLRKSFQFPRVFTDKKNVDSGKDF